MKNVCEVRNAYDIKELMFLCYMSLILKKSYYEYLLQRLLLLVHKIKN